MKEIEAIATRKQKRKADYGDYEAPMFEVTYQPKQCGVYNIYLFGAIEEPNQFIGAIEVLNRATEDDLVIVHLQTPGGSVDATDTFVSAMQECEADVIVQASGGVHSAGTIILLNAPMFRLSRDFNALVHNGSTGAGGKFSDFKAAAKAQEQLMDAVLRRTYEGFLTATELEAMLAGKDFWLDAKEFSTRFESKKEYMKAKYGLEEKEAEEFIELDPPKPAKKTRSKRTTQL